jgi:membrane carboxypeptidase/penicillin-binding protein
MNFKKILKNIVSIILIISLYLVIAGAWASLSVGDLLPKAIASNEQISLTKQQTDILLRIEDPTFFDHAGIDISQGQGLTTITSTLAREIFLSGKELVGVRGRFQSFYKAVFACCKKIDFGRDVMALVLNKNLSKTQQLQLFISRVYMGQHNRKAVIGLPAAANAYFNQNLSALSKQEFVTLIAMIKSPNLYHPVNNAKQLESRIFKINSILAGACKPSGWFDTEYEHCKRENQ